MTPPRLHHVGYVVTSIAEAADGFERSLGIRRRAEPIADPIQRVRVLFLRDAAGPDVDIELVEPAGADSPVAAFLLRGGGLHHLCYEVDDLAAHLEELRHRRAVLVRSPQPAAAFDGRRIAWMLTREKLLVEYLERARP